MKPADFPQLIADEIRAALGDDSEMRDPEEVIAAVTKALVSRKGVKTKANWGWALRTCVRTVYMGLRNGARPRAADIDKRRPAGVAQRPLPGWGELMRWRITSDDGLDVAAAYATLAQIEEAVRSYAKLAQANATKGQHLAVLADAMRTAGFQPTQTVEQFYQRAAESA